MDNYHIYWRCDVPSLNIDGTCIFLNVKGRCDLRILKCSPVPQHCELQIIVLSYLILCYVNRSVVKLIVKRMESIGFCALVYLQTNKVLDTDFSRNINSGLKINLILLFVWSIVPSCECTCMCVWVYTGLWCMTMLQ